MYSEIRWKTLVPDFTLPLSSTFILCFRFKTHYSDYDTTPNPLPSHAHTIFTHTLWTKPPMIRSLVHTQLCMDHWCPHASNHTNKIRSSASLSCRKCWALTFFFSSAGVFTLISGLRTLFVGQSGVRRRFRLSPHRAVTAHCCSLGSGNPRGPHRSRSTKWGAINHACAHMQQQKYINNTNKSSSMQVHLGVTCVVALGFAFKAT